MILFRLLCTGFLDRLIQEVDWHSFSSFFNKRFEIFRASCPSSF